MQAPNCIKILFCWITLPLAIFESIMKSPKKAEPVKAIHNTFLKPLKGAWVSLSNFFFNSGSIFDINYFEFRIILYENPKDFPQNSLLGDQQSHKKKIIGLIPIMCMKFHTLITWLKQIILLRKFWGSVFLSLLFSITGREVI